MINNIYFILVFISNFIFFHLPIKLKCQVKNIQRICIEVEKGSDTSKLNYPLDFLAEIFLSDFDTWGFFFTGEYFIKIHDVAIYDGVACLDLIRQMSPHKNSMLHFISS